MIMENLAELLKSTIPDVELCDVNNGDLQVTVSEPDHIPAVLSTVADAMFNYSLGDIQVTTNSRELKVWVRELDEEEE